MVSADTWGHQSPDKDVQAAKQQPSDLQGGDTGTADKDAAAEQLSGVYVDHCRAHNRLSYPLGYVSGHCGGGWDASYSIDAYFRQSFP